MTELASPRVTACAWALLVSYLLMCSAAAAGPPGERKAESRARAAHAQRFRVVERADTVSLVTPALCVDVDRDGAGLVVRRAGKVVLESARGDDPASNMGFMLVGNAERVTKLSSVRRVGDAVVFDFDTTSSGATARLELRPRDGAVRVTTWVILLENSPLPVGTVASPAMRYKLAPSGLWFGGGFQGFRQPATFPLNDARLSTEGFIESGVNQATPLWYSTEGVALWVRTPRDFRYSVNLERAGAPDGLLTVEMPGASSLAYDIVVGSDIRDVVRRVVREIGFPRAAPPADYIRLPIYTTWVEYKTEVSQERVLEFAKRIRENRLPCGVLEIDDKWEAEYGDTEFVARKFPDPRRMVDELHRMGFRVTLWVHNFVSPTSRTFAAHQRDGVLMRDVSGGVGLGKWWNGVCAVWDFTNPRAVAEFRGRLLALQRRFGFDGFKFDGGDLHRLPLGMRPAQNITPAEYADVYNREITAHFAWNETRVGIYSQPFGIVQRLHDINSQWGRANGLAAMIPAVTTVSLRGFQYVMPDIVGGNQYDDDRITKELLVRWAQASALMPFVQFGFGPWNFDAEAVRLAREASELHVRFAPYLIRLAREAPRSGEPIVAPLWYHSPLDAETYRVTDEYMVGPDVLVAPVVTEGAVARDIYVPAGQWRELATGGRVPGGRWLRGHPAPLDTVPVFVREGSDAGSPAAGARTGRGLGVTADAVAGPRRDALTGAALDGRTSAAGPTSAVAVDPGHDHSNVGDVCRPTQTLRHASFPSRVTEDVTSFGEGGFAYPDFGVHGGTSFSVMVRMNGKIVGGYGSTNPAEG